MSSEKNRKFSIKNIDDLLRCINLASSLELLGYPKPGNIHRTQDFSNTKFEHFFAGIAAIQPNFRELCFQAYNKYNSINENFSYIQLGKFFKETVKEMMSWQRGGNVLLGHILILAPLASSTAVCLKTEKTNYNELKLNLQKIIESTTVEDTIYLYDAIRLCNPGGLGKIKKFDINDLNSIEDIKKNKINLKKIFELSQDYDLISSEYVNNFNIILNEGFSYYMKIFNQCNDVNKATVNTYLKILSDHPDTLIIRKSGRDSALFVSKKAFEILKIGGITTKKGCKQIIELDKYLHKFDGKLNPGTSADLLAGILFCALIFGLKF